MNQRREFAVKCVKSSETHICHHERKVCLLQMLVYVTSTSCVSDGHIVGGVRFVTLFCVSW